MNITINGKIADIILEKEKNVGEIIANLEQWLSGLGHRLSAISINGKKIQVSEIEDFLSLDIDSVKSLDLETSSIAQLTAESLLNILDDIKYYESLNMEDKKNFLDNWKQSAQALFVSENIGDLYSILINAFAGRGLSSQAAASITEERLREVKEPQRELETLKTILDETCSRLTDISLDLQTGKDMRAAQTIQLFSSVTEKMFRIINQLNLQGLISEKGNIEKPFSETINELVSMIKDLFDAYERHDTVLVGDIAEYEAAGKLQELYTACMDAYEECCRDKG